MTVRIYVKSTLLLALIAISLGGLMLHLRIHPELPRFYGEVVKQVQLTKAVPFKTAILEPEAAGGGHPIALGLLSQKHVKGG